MFFCFCFCLFACCCFFWRVPGIKMPHFFEKKDTRENNVIPWETPPVVFGGRIPIKPPTGTGLSLLHLSTRLALLTLARRSFTFRFVLIRGPN